MDEPLSNLDAKLRVQMRAEIARIQRELGATTIYVTHDQVEAMTMGDRVAVMRKGELQQVRRPQQIYDAAGEPVRRELHRQPADEPGRGTPRARRRRSACRLGDQELAVPAELAARAPGLSALRRRDDRSRDPPEHLQDAVRPGGPPGAGSAARP